MFSFSKKTLLFRKKDYLSFFFLLLIANISLIYANPLKGQNEANFSMNNPQKENFDLNEFDLTQIPSFIQGFTENKGQLSDSRILYYFSSNSLFVGFSKSKITTTVITNYQESFTFELTYANANEIQPTGKNVLEHTTNYFTDRFTFTEINTWNEVIYYNIYENIDLRYYITERGMKYDFVVHPGGNLHDINIKSSSNVDLDISEQSIRFYKENDFFTPLIEDKDLFVYQENGRAIQSSFVAKNNDNSHYGFAVASYDNTQDLIIDPYWLTYSSLFSGNSPAEAYDMTMDSVGDIIVVGKSLDYPLPDSVNTFHSHGLLGDVDAFIMKINSTTNDVIFTSFLGGSGVDVAYSVAVDTNDFIYITGQTDSSFLTSDYLTYAGGNDAFMTILNTLGTNVMFHTYIGGNGTDGGRSITVDQSDRPTIIGITDTEFGSYDLVSTPSYFPVQGNPSRVYQNNSGGLDTFFTTFNGALEIQFSTFWGGNQDDYASDLQGSSTGEYYFTGSTTSSSGFPIGSNPERGTYQGTGSDIFISGIDRTGQMLFSTYWAQGTAENATALRLVQDSLLYLVGTTNTFGSSRELLLIEFDIQSESTSNELILGTFNTFTTGMDVDLDDKGNIYVVGYTDNPNHDSLPIIQSYPGGQYSGFLTIIDPTMGDIIYSSFIGGIDDDRVTSVYVKDEDNIYISGHTRSTNFPLINPYENITISTKAVFTSLYQPEPFLPTVTLNSPFNNSINKSQTAIHIAYNDSNSGVVSIEYQWETESIPTNVTFPERYDEQALLLSLIGEDGTHTLRVAVADLAGNVRELFFTFITDDTSPIINLLAPLNNSVHQSGIVLNGTIIDDNNISILLANWDGASNISLVNQTVTTPVGDGQHIFRIYARDDAGNWGSNIFVFITDDTDPIISLFNLSNNSVYQSGTIVNLSINELNGLNQTLFNWNGTQNSTFSSFGDIQTPLMDRLHNLTVYVQDEAGNWGFNQFTFLTDDTKPIISLISPSNQTTQQSGTELNLSIDELNIINQSLFNWDGNQNASFSVYGDIKTPTVDIYHNLTVFVQDEAGNWAVSRYIFVTDDNPPTIELTSVLNVSVIKSTTFINYSIFDISGLATVLYAWDNGTQSLFSFPYSQLAPITETTHYLHLFAHDNIGNWANQTFVFITDDTPPIISLNNSNNGTTLHSGTILNISLNEINNVTQSMYNWDGNQNASFSVYGDIITPIVDVYHNLTVFVQDEAGNWAVSRYVFVTDDNPPTIDLISVLNVSVIKSTTDINYSISDISGLSTVLYIWDNDTQSLFNSPYSQVAPIIETTHQLHIFAKDNIGNWANLTFVFITDDTPPIISLNNPTNWTTLHSGVLVNLSLIELNNLSQSMFNWDGNQNASFSVYGDIQIPIIDGPHQLNVYVKDEAGNWASQSYIFVTDDHAPIIIRLNMINTSIINSTTWLNFNISDITSGVATVLYAWDNNTNSTLNSPYSLSANVSEGEHKLHLYAVDGIGNWENLIFEITIDNTAPNISLLSPVNNTVHQSGVEIKFNITDNYNMSQVYYHWDTNASIPFNGTYISYIPKNDGIHLLIINAIDQAGNTIKKRYNFTTDDTPPNITIISPTNTTIIELTNITIIFQVQDNNSINQIRYNWDGFPNKTIYEPIPLKLLMNQTYHSLNLYAEDIAGNWMNYTLGFYQIDDTVTNPPPTTSEVSETTQSTSTEESSNQTSTIEFIQEDIDPALIQLMILVAGIAGVGALFFIIRTRSGKRR
ncbi:MAG: DUF7948 domain-containing protein [Candidatus Hodarchaeales archaeon]